MRQWFKIFLLLFVFGLLVYFNSFNNKFLMDDFYFLGNPVLSSTQYISSQWNPYGEQALGVIDRQGAVSYYRPMTHMLYDLSYAVFKNNFWQYHLFNLCLFAFAASLVYLLVGKLSGNTNLAFLTSLLYLIHPINGIVVNYISAGVFALEVIFILGTILLLLGSLERNNDRTLYFLSLLLSFLSLFWHESGIMIPFYVSAVIFLFRDGPLKSKVVYLSPYFLIILLYFMFRAWFLSTNDHIFRIMALYHMTGWEHLATFFRLVMWYITRLFYPQGIVMQWATPVLRQYLWWDNLGAVLLILSFLLLFFRFAKEKICVLAVVFILIGFAPVYFAGFRVPQVGALIEPHWFIFSSIGFFILAAQLFLVILERMKIFGSVSLLIVIISWGATSYAYNQLWADQKTYALYCSQQDPGFKLNYFYLADAYQDEGAFEQARRYYRSALMGDASDSEIYNNLGVMDAQEGDWKQAELNYKKVLGLNPFVASAYNNLGYICFVHGQFNKAKEYFSRALILNPLLTDARLNLARVFLKGSGYQKAIDLCRRNLDIAGNDTETLFLLVQIYVHQEDYASTKKYARRLISSNNDPKILTKLGGVLGLNGLADVALESFIKAIHEAPDYTGAYLNAGVLLMNRGEYNDAVHIWKLGSSVDPSDQRFKMEIAKAVKLIKSRSNAKD